MFSDYKEEVIKTYERKMERGDLSLNLQKPSPAKLRDECLIVITERYVPVVDDKILRTFFGHQENVTEYSRLIGSFDIDKFKPLVNLLKGNTNTTEDKNIELLSWLINFKPRPYSFSYEKNRDSEAVMKDNPKEDVVQNLDEKSYKREEEAIKQPSHDEASNTKKPTEKETKPQAKKLKKILVFVGLFSFIGLSIDLFSANSWVLKTLSLSSPQCMYWNGDHFESIECDQGSSNRQIIALDEEKLHHFQKITRTDTLKKDCIGKIWYSKINKEVEFFTISGMHPINNEKSLKLVTRYIYDTYLDKDKPNKAEDK